MGHATPTTTARSYAHFIRKTFDTRMTLALGDGEPTKAIPIEAGRPTVSTAPAEAANDAEVSRPAATATPA